MTVHQISVFVENKSGTLVKVLDLLKDAGIQLIASTISDTVEYGIFRIICSEPMKARKVLEEAGVSSNVSDVFAVSLDNYPGRAADAVRFLSKAGIGISYMYSFMLSGKGILIFRTDDPERTKEVIRVNGIESLNDESLLSLV